eukprot:m.205680 g.205680  ORF g.205680 m.205680 type:complete len:1653 (+) comp17763_c0_seq1:181-5139(+)
MASLDDDDEAILAAVFNEPKPQTKRSLSSSPPPPTHAAASASAQYASQDHYHQAQQDFYQQQQHRQQKQPSPQQQQGQGRQASPHQGRQQSSSPHMQDDGHLFEQRSHRSGLERPPDGMRSRGFSYILLDETAQWSQDRLDDGLVDPEKEKMKRMSNRVWGWGQLFLALGTLVLFSLVLVSTVVSKLALGTILNELHHMMIEKASGKGDDHNDERQVGFVYLVAIILIPQAWTFCINLFRSLYTSAKHSPAPSCMVIPYILLQAIAESTGMCIFLLYVAPRLSPLQAILFLNGVYCFPARSRIKKALGIVSSKRRKNGLNYTSVPTGPQNNNNNNNSANNNNNANSINNSTLLGNSSSAEEPPFGVLERTIFLLAHVVQIGCLGMVPYVLYRNDAPLKVCVLFPISQLLLSASWLPKLQEKMIYTEEGNTSRCKTAAIASFLRLCFTFVIAILTFYITGDMSGMSVSHIFSYMHHSRQLQAFLFNVVASFVCYNVAILGCAMSVQRMAFALPLALATPLTVLLTLTGCDSLPFTFDVSCAHVRDIAMLVIIAFVLWISGLMIARRTMWNSKAPSVAMDEALNIQPTYNAVYLEQHTILNRRPPDYGDTPVLSTEEYLAKSSIFICSTMYNEDEEEMKSLLRSILDIDRNLFGSCHIESHIFMDGAAQGHRLEKTALRLIKAVRTLLLAERNEKEKFRPGRELKIEEFDPELRERAVKIYTPYGIRIEFLLPCGMPLLLHLKDPTKVKKKKRWSQVMYMYYLLQFRRPKIHDFEADSSTYILTTDADVSFTTRDVKTLFALLSRNKQVGAVCGRTLPLGEGPLYWYQMFDYAIGHWFQKTAEHVLGTVLCCPGCFSMYRFEALRCVLREYGSDVEKAEEFLTKDMGEDRWLCTLLVLNEWRLEYTAAAYNQTHVPEDFNEFWNQRRRWIVSTVANILELIRNWNVARRNDSISHMFMLYQFFMLVSSVLSPATVILVVIGGLNYATGISVSIIAGFIISATVFFWIICLFTAQSTQLAVAKFLTLLSALVMAAVTVGVAAEIGTELANGAPSPPPPPPTDQPHTSTHAPNSTLAGLVLELASSSGTATIGSHGVSVSTIYLGSLIAMFLIAGLFHIDEFSSLVAGFVYLLCLPGGYLFLIIYSFANLNDRSWGTRVDASSQVKTQGTWLDELFRGCGRYPTEGFYHFFGRALCCRASVPEPQAPPPQAFTLVVDSQFSKNDRTWRVADDNEHLECSPVLELVHKLEAIVRTGGNEETHAELKKIFHAAERAWPDMANGQQWAVLWSRAAAEGAAVWTQLLEQIRAKMSSKIIDRHTNPLGPPKHESETTADFLCSLGITDVHVHSLFSAAGYDDTTFLVGLTQDDLTAIGIDSLQNGRRLCSRILNGCLKVTKHGIPDVVPKELKQWLEMLHLDYYMHNFQAFGYTTEDLELMRGLTENDAHRMGIRKRAHKKKFMNGLRKLTSLIGQGAAPEDTPDEIKAEELAREFVHLLGEKSFGSSLVAQGGTNIAVEEEDFWKAMINQKIGSHLEKTGKLAELKDNLQRYRNSAVLVIFLLNAFWVVLMLILQTHQAGNLHVIGTNPLGLLFLVLYGGIFVVQFLALVWHRMGTVIQALSQIPFPLFQSKVNVTNRSNKAPRPLSIIQNEIIGDLDDF